MALIKNLSEHGMQASSIHTNQPADSRLVVVQSVNEGHVRTIGARYCFGRWIGDGEGRDVTDDLSADAIWFESPLFLPSSAPQPLPAISLRRPG